MKTYRIKFSGKEYEVEVEELEIGSPAPVEKVPVREKTPKATQCISTGDESVTAPMPGTIIDVKVGVGDNVKTGQVLMLLEAMKLENEIVALRDGVVKSINISKGEAVQLGDNLVVLG